MSGGQEFRLRQNAGPADVGVIDAQRYRMWCGIMGSLIPAQNAALRRDGQRGAGQEQQQQSCQVLQLHLHLCLSFPLLLLASIRRRMRSTNAVSELTPWPFGVALSGTQV